MRRAPFIIVGMLAIPLFAIQGAQASEGRLSDAVQMRAGPDGAYPSVTRLAKGLSVDIHGCLKSWDWCDVSWRGNRGWVPATAIYNQRAPISKAGPQSGVPEVTFQLNAYWDQNYNQSLWYNQRDAFNRQTARYNVQ